MSRTRLIGVGLVFFKISIFEKSIKWDQSGLEMRAKWIKHFLSASVVGQILVHGEWCTGTLHQIFLPSPNPQHPQCSGSRGDRNIVENIFNLLERYSRNLEGEVSRRTEELAAEKLKTESLLHEMLPPIIARQLLQGTQIPDDVPVAEHNEKDGCFFSF